MRPILSVLLVLAVAWGVHTLLSSGNDVADDDLPRPSAPPRPAPATDRPTRVSASTGTLIIRVRTPEGAVPNGARVGHELLGDPRWARVGDEGRHAFTDVPLGPVDALAEAPGYEFVRQRRELVAGVATEVVLVLRKKQP